MTQKASLLKALIDAGARGLTYREIVDAGIVDGRFVHLRVRELQDEHVIAEDFGRFARTPSRRGGRPRPWRWIYIQPREPLTDDTPDPQPALLATHSGAAPACALIGEAS